MNEDIDFSDTNIVDDLMANCNQLRDRCWKAESELDRWQKIAIEATARAMWEGRDGDITYTDYEKQAARELNLQATHEAGYVKRLESAFLDMWKIQLNLEDSDLLPESWGELNDEVNVLLQKQAQAALTKIREGKP